jgi:hypothetical protein
MYIRLINNAMLAYNNSKTDWAQEYWLGVVQSLIQSMEARKELH